MHWAGDVTHSLRALAARSEAPGSFLSTDMVAHTTCNSSSGESSVFFPQPQVPGMQIEHPIPRQNMISAPFLFAVTNTSQDTTSVEEWLISSYRLRKGIAHHGQKYMEEGEPETAGSVCVCSQKAWQTRSDTRLRPTSRDPFPPPLKISQQPHQLVIKFSNTWACWGHFYTQTRGHTYT